jgi:hypothetical protein
VYLERALFAEGFEVLHLSVADLPHQHLPSILKVARSAGLVVILSSASVGQQGIQSGAIAAAEQFESVLNLAKQDLPQDDAEAVTTVLSMVSSLRKSNR